MPPDPIVMPYVRALIAKFVCVVVYPPPPPPPPLVSPQPPAPPPPPTKKTSTLPLMLSTVNVPDVRNFTHQLVLLIFICAGFELAATVIALLPPSLYWNRPVYLNVNIESSIQVLLLILYPELHELIVHKLLT